jgi:hypothetical protein
MEEATAAHRPLEMMETASRRQSTTTRVWGVGFDWERGDFRRTQLTQRQSETCTTLDWPDTGRAWWAADRAWSACGRVERTAVRQRCPPPRNPRICSNARLPFVDSHAPPTAAVQEDLWRADERQERAARNLVQSFTFGALGVGSGHRHARRGRPSAFRKGVPTFSGSRVA